MPLSSEYWGKDPLYRDGGQNSKDKESLQNEWLAPKGGPNHSMLLASYGAADNIKKSILSTWKHGFGIQWYKLFLPIADKSTFYCTWLPTWTTHSTILLGDWWTSFQYLSIALLASCVVARCWIIGHPLGRQPPQQPGKLKEKANLYLLSITSLRGVTFFSDF